MKLNAAAVFVLTIVLSFVLLCFGGAAFALDDFDLSHPGEPVEDEACPRLFQIKYPFLACGESEVASPADDPDWENTRQIPRRSEFIEGDGYWGPDLNG